QVPHLQKTINEYGNEKDRPALNDQLNKIKAEGEKAISQNDRTLLARVNEQLSELWHKTMYSNPATWVYHFQEMIEGKNTFVNEQEAQYYIEKGKKAIEHEDIDELKRCLRSLIELLPPNQQEAFKNNISGITR
ncbi:MAG: hypothetical protein ACHQYP_10495, partial [Nitrospiria bacterium]